MSRRRQVKYENTIRKEWQPVIQIFVHMVIERISEFLQPVVIAHL